MKYIDKSSFSVSTLRKTYGDEWLEGYLEHFMTYLREYTGLESNIDNNMWGEICSEAMRKYYYFTLPDLKLFFQMARTGQFSNPYGKLNGFVLNTWLEEYNQKRMSHAVDESMDKRAQDLGRNSSNDNWWNNKIKNFSDKTKR